MRAEYLSYRLLLSYIPNSNVRVPSSRNKLVGVAWDRLNRKDSIGVIWVFVIRCWSYVNSLNRFCIVMDNFNREVLLANYHIFPCSWIITAHDRRIQVNSFNDLARRLKPCYCSLCARCHQIVRINLSSLRSPAKASRWILGFRPGTSYSKSLTF